MDIGYAVHRHQLSGIVPMFQTSSKELCLLHVGAYYVNPHTYCAYVIETPVLDKFAPKIRTLSIVM